MDSYSRCGLGDAAPVDPPVFRRREKKITVETFARGRARSPRVPLCFEPLHACHANAALKR